MVQDEHGGLVLACQQAPQQLLKGASLGGVVLGIPLLIDGELERDCGGGECTDRASFSMGTQLLGVLSSWPCWR